MLVFVSVFLGCGALVYFFSVIGVRGETFEEALEKQRNEKNKEKKKEKKPPTEKKKKQKKGKDAKATSQEFEDEILLVEAAGQVVEPVFVETAAAPAPQAPVVQESKPKKEKKKAEKPVVVEEKIAKEVKAVAVAEKPQAVAAAVVEEKVAVIEQQVVVEKAVETAAVQQQAAVPPPKQEKKKIEIVEVVEAPKAEETEEKKAIKKKTKKAATKSNYDEVLAVIRKTPLSSTEAQGIVDILLLKQTGKEEDSDEWIELGKETEAKKMSRQLGEVTVELEGEKEKSAALEKKMASVRKELNEVKSVQSGHKREVEELTNKKNTEISSLNARLQQLMGQVNSSTSLNRQLESTQTHYQATINNLKTQLAQLAAGNDPNVLSELEAVKKSSAELTVSHQSLTASLNSKVEEIDQLAAQNNQLNTQLAVAVEDKVTANKNLDALQQKLDEQMAGSKQQLDSQLSSSQQQFDSQLSALSAAKQQLQMELTVLKEKLGNKEVEYSRLLEENERLSEQVASSVERPAVEGEEAAKLNGHQEVEQPKQEPVKDTLLEEKYTQLQAQFKQIEVREQELNAELEISKTAVAKLEAKNDESVSALESEKKSWSSMFARIFPAVASGDQNQLEQAAKDVIQSLESSKEEAVSRAASAAEAASKTATEAASKAATDAASKAAEAASAEEHAEEIQKLDSQVHHYKKVLAQTEDMLHSLQMSVERAEAEWKKKFESVESEKSVSAGLVDQFKSKNTSLEETVENLNSKIQELERTSAEEVSSKEGLAKKCAELQQLVAAGQQQINHIKEGEIVSNGSVEEEAN